MIPAETTQPDIGARAWQAIAAPFRRSPKKTVALCSLLPLLVMAWIPVLSGPDRPSVSPAAASATVPSDLADPGVPIPAGPPGAAVGAAAQPETSLDEAALAVRMAQLRQPFAPRWIAHTADDPFSSAMVRAASSVRSDATRVQELAPSSIFLSGNRPPVAVIQGRSYQPGDEIQGLVIEAIEERRVLFRHGENIFSVSIPEPDVGRDHD